MIAGQEFSSKLLGEKCFNLYEKLRTDYNMVDIIDANGIIRYVSNTLERAIGYEVNDLIGKNAIELLVHPDDYNYVLGSFQELVKDRTPKEVKYELRKKDGTFMVVRSIGIPMIHDGNVFGYIILTKRRTADIIAFRKKGRVLTDMVAI